MKLERGHAPCKNVLDRPLRRRTNGGQPMPDAGKVVKNVGRTAGKVGRSAGETAGKVGRTAGRTAGKIAGTVGDAASDVVKAVGKALPMGDSKPKRRRS